MFGLSPCWGRWDCLLDGVTRQAEWAGGCMALAWFDGQSCVSDWEMNEKQLNPGLIKAG